MSPQKPTINKSCLFIFRDHIVKGIVSELAARCYSLNCHSKSLPSPLAPLSTPGRFFEIWHQIRVGEIKSAIVFSHHYDLMRPEKNPLRNAVRFLKSLFLNFPGFSTRLYEWLLRTYHIPYVVYDDEDHTQINKRNWGLLKGCHTYFKLHVPVNLFYCFLHQDDRTGSVHNIHRNTKFQGLFHKIKPISLGVELTPGILDLAPSPKHYDVFFAGTTKYSWIRQRGLEELEALQKNSNLKILICRERIPHAEFTEKLRASWLILSPEGGCYDSFRHYESLLNYSVPLINYPQVLRYKPMVEGVHCLFYAPEPGGLTRSILEALQDKSRLEKIAAQGRAFVLENHLQRQIAQIFYHTVNHA